MSDSLSSAPQQTITFDEIVDDWRVPSDNVEVRPNYEELGLLGFQAKALILTQMATPGNAASAVPGAVYPIIADGQEIALFGPGSIAAQQIQAWRANNKTTPLFAIAVTDATGAVAAFMTTPIVVPGTTTQAAINQIWNIAGTKVFISIPAGSNAAAVAAAIIAEVNDTYDIPVLASLVAPASVKLTALNGGTVGNSFDVRILSRSDALSPLVTIIFPTRTLTGGSGDPDIGTVLTSIARTWYTDIVIPWTDSNNRGEFAAELVRRYGAMVNLDARGYMGVNGTYGALSTYGSAGNNPYIMTIAAQGMVEPPCVWAAAFGAVHAFRLANDPSRQSRGIAVAGLTAPADADLFDPATQNLLLHTGISTFETLPDGTVVIQRSISGYLVSNLGVPDTAWLDIMQSAVATRIRYDWKNYMKLQYPQAKLFDDDSIGAQYDETAVTPKRARGSWASRCQLYERAGWIEGTAATAQLGYFVRNPDDDNRLDCQVKYKRAGNLMVLDTALEFEV